MCASEFNDNNIHFTTINMPLVRTPMIAPTKMYNSVPTLSPSRRRPGGEAIVYKPVRIATRLGIAGAILHAVSPKLTQIILNTAFRMFPDSSAAQGQKGEAAEGSRNDAGGDGVAQIRRGSIGGRIHARSHQIGAHAALRAHLQSSHTKKYAPVEGSAALACVRCGDFWLSYILNWG